MAGTWSIEDTARRLRVTLRGDFDDEDAQGLESELDETLGDRKELMFLLDGLASVSRGARMHLADLQRRRSESTVRTAYVSNRALLRGVALWIVHFARDPDARGFSNEHQAERWFETRDERPVLLRDRALQSLRLLRGRGGGS